MQSSSIPCFLRGSSVCIHVSPSIIAGIIHENFSLLSLPPPGIILWSVVSGPQTTARIVWGPEFVFLHDTSAAALSEVATTRSWLLHARTRLCPCWSASRCCCQKSSSTRQYCWIRTLVNFLLSASKSKFCPVITLNYLYIQSIKGKLKHFQPIEYIVLYLNQGFQGEDIGSQPVIRYSSRPFWGEYNGKYYNRPLIAKGNPWTLPSYDSRQTTGTWNSLHTHQYLHVFIWNVEVKHVSILNDSVLFGWLWNAYIATL